MERTPTVRVEMEGECRCPGAPHPVDWVELAGKTPIAVGAAVMAAVNSAGDNRGLLEGLMGQAYVTFGIRAWSFVDEDGPVQVDSSRPEWADAIERWLPWADGGKLVMDRADALYSADILRPLLSRTSTSLPGGPMDCSTSPTPASGSTTQRQSKSSSPASGEDGKPSGDPDP